MAGFRQYCDQRPISLGMVLCEPCLGTIRTIGKSPPGSHLGSWPQSFTFAPRDDTWRGQHHVRNGSFLESVSMGCYICYMLHQACPRQLLKCAEFIRSFFEIRPKGQDRYHVQFVIELRDPSTASVTQKFEHHGTFKIIPKVELDAETLDLKWEFTARTDTPECKQQLQDWLKVCTKSHESCNEDVRINNKYRIRFIEVSPKLGSNVRLCEFARGKNHPKYVTMSHCWDHATKHSLMMLKKDRERNLRAGMDIQSLPPKFRDAIKIARWLEVEYIWIDALCIMQDSPKDWAEQSAMMGDIYAGSYCNIAATNPDESTGIFRNRPVAIVQPYLIQSPSSNSEEKIPQTKTHVIGYDDFWCNSLLESPLHTRAWVLQERLLSPRTIHFGQEQMFWECRGLKACEAYPTKIPEVFTNDRTAAWRTNEIYLRARTDSNWTQWIFGLFGMKKHTLSPTSIREAYAAWNKIVERYMECDLSRPADKLVAIAGIANKMRHFTNHRYLAGLWDNEYLAPSLLWYVILRKQADGRSSFRWPSLGMDGYRGPSWSWASIDAKIACSRLEQSGKLLVDLKGSNVKIDRRPVGTVESAKMPLRGRIYNVRLRVLNSNVDGTPKEDGSYSITSEEIYGDDDSNNDDANDCQKSICEDESTTEPIVFLDTPLARRSIRAQLLPICTHWRYRLNYPTVEVAGLILRKYRLQGATYYQRIGVFGLDEPQACMSLSTDDIEDTISGATSPESIILV